MPQRPSSRLRTLGRPPGAASRGALLASAAVALLTGCALKSGPGKHDVTPTFKRYVVEHPVALGERTLRSGSTEVRLERVVVEEHRTVLGPDAWLGVLHVVIVNHGEAPILFEDLVGAFQIHTRGGSVLRGTAFPDGSRDGGWNLREHTRAPTQLPPGGAGRVRVQAGIGTKGTHDDPSAMTFRDGRLDFR